MGRRAGARWARRQSAFGLSDPRAAGRVLRLALCVYRQAPAARLREPRPRQSRNDDHARSLFQAHSSVLDLVFYEADQFPPEYKGGLFVALKGSWNRSLPTGYKIVRIPFKDGQPEGYYENFATGFWASGNERAEVWGRPAALAIAKDGALLVADDT